MPSVVRGRLVLLAFAFISAVPICSFSPAMAQVMYGPESAPGASNSSSGSPSTSSGGAPLFSIPNFIGDRRVDDLYVYMHEMSKPSWDTYRQYVQGLAGRTVNQQPLRWSPDASTAGNSTPANQMLMAAPSVASQMTGGSSNNGQGSVSGSNQGVGAQEPAAQPPPVETMTPPEAMATNYDLPATTNVSGMVVGPGSDIPGLLP